MREAPRSRPRQSTTLAALAIPTAAFALKILGACAIDNHGTGPNPDAQADDAAEVATATPAVNESGAPSLDAHAIKHTNKVDGSISEKDAASPTDAASDVILGPDSGNDGGVDGGPPITFCADLPDAGIGGGGYNIDVRWCTFDGAGKSIDCGTVSAARPLPPIPRSAGVKGLYIWSNSAETNNRTCIVLPAGMTRTATDSKCASSYVSGPDEPKMTSEYASTTNFVTQSVVGPAPKVQVEKSCPQPLAIKHTLN